MENTKENTEEVTPKKPQKWKNSKRILPSILISISIPMIICLAVPFEVYSNNMQEFLFGLWDFLPLSLAFGLLFAGIVFCVLLFLPDRLYKILSLGILAVALLFFIQANYLNGGLNSLAGDNLGSAEPSAAMKAINLIVWIVLIGGAVGVTFIKDKKDIVGKVALVLACIVILAHLVIPIFAICTHGNVFISKNDKLKSSNSTSVTKFVSTKNLTTISSTNNVFYFCIDRFDEYYAEGVYESDPELFDMLDGFTGFRDNISLYGHTFPGVAHLLTNYEYDISLYRAENLSKAYAENTTLKTLHENGYQINLFGQSYYDYDSADSLPEYVDNVSVLTRCKIANPFMLCFNMMGLAIYRCSPLLAKSLYSNISTDRCNSFVGLKDADGNVDYSSQNAGAYKQVKASPFETTDKKVFSFIHFEGCHNENFDYRGGTAKPSSKSYKKIKKSVKDCFEIIGMYITALKETGVYKDATIIITGDHGVPSIDNDSGLSGNRLTALFVKPSGSAGEELKFSDAQVTHKNVWPMIMQSENIEAEEDYGVSLFDVDPNEDAVREHVWHTYNRRSLDEYSYIIRGSGRSFDNWELVQSVHKDKYIMD